MPRTLVDNNPTIKSMRVLIFTDAHYGQHDFATDYDTKFAPRVVIAKTYNPDLVITTGDCIDGDDNVQVKTVASEFVAYMNTFNCPWIYCPGNHDQEFWSDLSPHLNSLGINTTFPYVYIKNGYRFVALNTGTSGANGAVDTADITWIQNTFARDTMPTIYFHHHPLNSGSYTITNATNYKNAFKQNGNTKAVIFGHDHDSTNKTKDQGIAYLAARRGGSWWGASEGFAILDIQPTFMNYFTVRDDGVATNDNFCIPL